MIRAEHIVKSFDGRVVLDDISVEFETGKTNLIIGRSGSGKTVLLIGHIDTVGVSDRWKTDPFTPTEIDGKVYGRGAMDMKGASPRSWRR